MKPLEPLPLVGGVARFTQVTFGRATANNGLVHGRLNPRQERFQLLVSLVSQGRGC